MSGGALASSALSGAGGCWRHGGVWRSARSGLVAAGRFLGRLAALAVAGITGVGSGRVSGPGAGAPEAPSRVAPALPPGAGAGLWSRCLSGTVPAGGGSLAAPEETPEFGHGPLAVPALAAREYRPLQMKQHMEPAPHKRAPCAIPTDSQPTWPPQVLALDMMFFRRLFDQLENEKYTTHGKVHITVLRNVDVRLQDAMGMNGFSAIQDGFFAMKPDAKKTWFNWMEVCEHLRRDGVPAVSLNLAERINITLEAAETSKLARLSMTLMMFVIIGNLSVVVLASLPGDQCQRIVVDLEGEKCGGHFQNFCMVVFSLEYIVKFICSPFVRHELFDHEWLLSKAMIPHRPTTLFDKPPHGQAHRVVHFVLTPSNAIDLVSVLPAWISVLLGGILPSGSTSFLRVLRVTRVFRIMKTGRYMETIQILGVVLANSVRSVVVLLLFISIVGLIGGVLLQQFESGKLFTTVPKAWYWILMHLLGPVKEVPNYKGKVKTPWGVMVLSVVMTLKAILWILPIGQVKSLFDSASDMSKKNAQSREDVIWQLTRSPWSHWSGLDDSARAHLKIWAFEDSGEGVPSADRKSAGAANLPVPILRSGPVHSTLDVPISNGELVPSRGQSPSITIEIQWEPSDRMQTSSEKPAMPLGKLALRVLSGSGFPGSGRWIGRVDVPVGFAAPRELVASQEIMSKSIGPTPSFDVTCEFTVDWTLADSSDRHAEPQGRSAKHENSRPEDLARAIRENLSQLTEQQSLLEAQSRKLDEQTKCLDALESKLVKR